MAARGYHYPCLDGLRGLAILLVIPHNSNIVEPVSHGPFRYLTIFIDRGWVGVELFFVLSGFLITEQLCRSRDSANYYSGFYARRALRIVPLFMVAAGLVLICLRAQTGHGAPALPGAWIFLFGLFFINWTQPLGLGVPAFPQFWSLALEEQFYLVWPIIVRSCAARLLAIAVAIVLGALAVRVVMLAFGANSLMVYMWTIARMDALAFGALAALLVQHWRTSGRIPSGPALLIWGLAAALSGALMTRLYAGGTWATQTVGFACLGAACFLIVLAAVANDLAPRSGQLFAALRSRALISVGRYSYGMYVLHMFFAIFAATWVRQLTERFGAARMLACAVVMIALSYVAGFLSYHLLEKHFLRFSHRHFAPRNPSGEGCLQNVKP